MISLTTNTKRLENQISGQISDKSDHNSPSSKSAVLLRVYAAADFYASDKNLMLDPPSVDVDISTSLVSAGYSGAKR